MGNCVRRETGLEMDSNGDSIVNIAEIKNRIVK